jgi:hypothetical protein
MAVERSQEAGRHTELLSLHPTAAKHLLRTATERLNQESIIQIEPGKDYGHHSTLPPCVALNVLSAGQPPITTGSR